MVGLIFPHLQYQQHDHIFSDHHPINHNNNNNNNNITNSTPNNNNKYNSTPHALGVGVIPLLSTANTVIEDSTDENRETHMWELSHTNYLKKPVLTGAAIFNSGNSSSTGNGQITCSDCGNQAKKDCSHRRCRTCCRSHGFSCSTHVKSTWIPAARRRQISGGGGCVGAGDGSSASASTAKRARVIALESNSMFSHISMNSNTTTTRSSDTSSSQRDAGFKESLPDHVQAPAVFKCVRMTAIDNGEDEYMYHAMVKIRGHVFKGILYDHGVDQRRDLVSDISDLHLGGPSARNNGLSSSPILDHPEIYAATGNGSSVAAFAYGNTIS